MSTEAGSPITTYFRVCDGVRVRFADTKADSDTTVLLLAPWPESLWAFRRIWDRVAAVGRVVAIDLPGFGHSDGRPELIAPDSSGAFLARLIDEWGLGAPHVVGPDVGTAAALFLAAKAPERVTSLTDRRRRGPLPDRSGRRAQGHHRGAEPGRRARARRQDQHRPRGRAGCRRAPASPTSTRTTSAPTTSDASPSRPRFVRHYPEQNPVLRDLLPSITTPTQIVAGRDDDLVPWSNNQYLARPPPQQRDPSSRRRPLRVGASAGGVRPPGRRLGHRRVPPCRSALADTVVGCAV